MFCPKCGLEDIQANQFCRSCGADLRQVRTALARPDQITESAASAREEIGRAVAGRIREMSSATELAKVTEEVLPEIEKFLESPAEKKLRRMRVGTILSTIGAGAALGITIAAMAMGDSEILFIAALGVVCFFLGLGFILNGIFLTVPRTALPEDSNDADRPRELDAEYSSPTKLGPADAKSLFPSVTEHTTKHLKKTD
ncbi:MAG TPA: zinc ribbon domain-containing protein [Pyrinomonadaceae bacterium]|nr:zinc ribbon domain-containing protein [Pyrinomonadaceae bacterium]